MSALWNNIHIYHIERSIPMADISNEMVLQAIKELAEQLTNHSEETNKRFEQIDKWFEQIDRRFGQIDERFEQIDQQFE